MAALVATARSRFNDPASEAFAAVLLFAIVQAVGFIVIALWMGEIERMLRAGTYVSEKEKTINRGLRCRVGQEAVGFETRLRSQPRPRIISTQGLVGAVLLGSMIAAYFMGLDLVGMFDLEGSSFQEKLKGLEGIQSYGVYLAPFWILFTLVYYWRKARRLLKMAGLKQRRVTGPSATR